MKNACSLTEKHCIPCQGGIPPLDGDAIAVLLSELGNGWHVNDRGHLYKEYNFADFMEPMAFANRISELAEEEAHHPDLTIAWGKCSIEIWTHKIDGLHESDFILAAKIDMIS